MPRAGNAIVSAHFSSGTLGAMNSADLLAGVTAETLAEKTGVDLTTARRWKRTGRVPAPARRLLALHIQGDLGALSPLWEHWALRDGRLYGPDGFAFEAREILSLPFLQRQVTASQARLRWSVQADWVDQRWSPPGESQAGPRAEEFRQRPQLALTAEELAHRDKLLARRRARGR
jgi:hypothetical protein